MKKIILIVVTLLVTSLQMLLFSAEANIDIEISPDIEINIQQYGDDKDQLLMLWLPSESGQLSQEIKYAKQLAAQGYSVWFADLLSAWFLPAVASSIERLPEDDIATLLEKVRVLSNKKVYLVASGRGALLSLRVARAWQQRYGEQATLGGVIMISPKLFVETPEPGHAGEFMPVVSQTNLPLLILQPSQSPWRWKLDRTIPILEKSGSDVFAWILPGVRDRFYYRTDASKVEEQQAKALPQMLRSATELLSHYNQRPRIISQQAVKAPKVTEGKKERLLRAYTGDTSPPQLKLKTLQGQSRNLKEDKGKVVLVNFWASWCPPCVHEMPSMQKLSEHFSDQAFEILAVNMAEDKKTVTAFLREKVNVKFPILMDLDGSALKRWNVFAFPTSYVIDKQGKIRLALFGAIDWMNKDVIQQLEELVQER